MEDFILKEMTVEDIPEIYNKLHLKYVEKYCIEDKDKGLKEYEIWYSFLLNSPCFKMYIIKNKNSKLISLIKFELFSSSALINIYVDENMRGKGFSYLSIIKGIEEILKRKNLKYIDAYILKENEVSKHIFKKLGFIYKKNCNYNGVRHMVYRLTLPFCYNVNNFF